MMRTKTLLLAAAVGVASAATSMAQVYSVNAVGYINLEICPGFSIIANQLDNGDGNTVADVLGTDLPEGTTVYDFNPDTGVYDINTLEFGEWAKPGNTLDIGKGVFIKNPGAEAATVTLVGEVPQGTLTTAVPEGFSILASQVPQEGALGAVLGYPEDEGDMAYLFDCGTQNYKISTFEFGEWGPTVPTPMVGEGVFLKAVAAKNWTREFSVNPTP